MTSDQIEEIKNKLDIVEIISEKVSLKKAGRNFRACCPFHNEKTPSFMVSPELQIFKCFGCGAGGDLIKFVQLYDKLSFGEALETLAERAGVKLVRRKMSQEDLFRQRLYQLNRLVADFYHWCLTKHDLGKKTLDYVLSRGINLQTIKAFNLGFSPLKPDAVVGVVAKKGFGPQDLMAAGLVYPRSGSYFDRFSSRLTFPLLNHRGLTVGFSGRIVPNVSTIKQPKYTNTPETKIYHKGENLFGLWLNRQGIREKKEIILVEGEFDVISSYQQGIKNVVAIKGTGFTIDQAKLIRRFAPLAILALDSDSAGSEAIKRSGQVAESVGLDIKVIQLPSNVADLDDLIKKFPDKISPVLNKKIPLWDFVINLAVKKYPGSSAESKKKILLEVLPFLVGIDNQVVKSHYLKRLADLLDVDLEAVLAEAGKVKVNKQGSGVSFKQPPAEVVVDRRQLLERQLLMLIFFHQQWSYFSDPRLEKLVTTPLLQKIFVQAKDFFSQDKVDINQFAGLLPAELVAGFEDLFLKMDSEVADISEKEIETVVIELEKHHLKEKLDLLTKEISKLEKEKRLKIMKQKEQEFVQLSHRLVALENQ